MDSQNNDYRLYGLPVPETAVGPFTKNYTCLTVM